MPSKNVCGDFEYEYFECCQAHSIQDERLSSVDALWTEPTLADGFS